MRFSLSLSHNKVVTCDQGVSAYKIFYVVTKCVVASHNKVVTKGDSACYNVNETLLFDPIRAQDLCMYMPSGEGKKREKTHSIE
jgi:hypothetical protein